MTTFFLTERPCRAICLLRKEEAAMPVTFLNYLEDLAVGQTASYSKVFTEKDLLLFAEGMPRR